MADHENAAVFLCEVDYGLGIRHVGGQGLFDQHIHSGFNELLGAGAMLHRGHGDRYGMQRCFTFAAPLLEFLDR